MDRTLKPLLRQARSAAPLPLKRREPLPYETEVHLVIDQLQQVIIRNLVL